MVELEQINQANREAYEHITLGPGQEQFVYPSAQIIRMHFDEGYGEYLFGIKYDHQPVGILTIHSPSHGVEHSLKTDTECWLKGFMVGVAFQRKGIAGQTMDLLSELLSSRYEWMSLTVNLRNQRAIAVYEKMGFIDTGELYYGGPAGPQKIMRKRLK